MKLTTLRLALTLILFSWSFTALSQQNRDSLICFTKAQAREILSTKVELENCIFQYNAKMKEIDSLSSEISNSRKKINDLSAENEKLDRKKKRRGKIILGGSIILAVETLFLILL